MKPNVSGVAKQPAVLHAYDRLCVLTSSVAIVLWCVHYTSGFLTGMFPPGLSPKVDTLYVVAPFARWVAWSIVAALATLALKEKRRGGLLFLGAAGVAAALDFAPAIMAAWPWLSERAEVTAADRKLKRCDAAHAVLTTAIGGVVLMTFAINLTYYAQPRDMIYMTGLCAAMTAAIVLAGAILMPLLASLPGRIGGTPVAPVVLLTSVMAGAYAYCSPYISTFSDKLNMTKAPAGFSALVVAAGFALTSSPARFATLGMAAWRRPYGEGYMAVLRILIVLILARVAYGVLRSGEQDVAWEVLRDTTLGITPLLTTLTASQIATSLLSLRRVQLPLVVGAVTTVAAVLAFSAANLAAPWTHEVESSRDMGLFVSKNVRAALATGGIASAAADTAADALLRRMIQERLGLEAGSARPAGTEQFVTQPPDTGRPPPHIFVFVSDATAKDRLSAYGYGRETTPFLNKFAEESVVFLGYRAVSSATFQNVLTMFTGEYAGRNPPVDDSRGRLCQALEKAGYKVFLSEVAAKILAAGPLCPGIEMTSMEGNSPADYERYRASLEREPGRPHFVYIHVNGGHNPWTLPDDLLVFGRGMLDVYDAMIRESDRHFGDLLAFLRTRRLADRSVVIYTADHGIGLGRHFDKSSYSNLYSDNLDIPLVMRVPGGAARKDDTLRSHLDFAPTVADLAGVPEVTGFRGVTLMAEAPPDRCVFAIAEYRTAFASICPDRSKFVWEPEQRLLRRYSTDDPAEREPLALETGEGLRPRLEPLADFIARGTQTYLRDVRLAP